MHNTLFGEKMFEALNLLFTAVTVTGQAINVIANAQSNILIQENTRVYAITMNKQAPMWADKCLFNGVIVEYARDWEQLEESTGIMLPPAPDTPIGYAIILTKEKCEGADERAIFRTGSKFFYSFMGKQYVVGQGYSINAADYASQSEQLRPKWLPQVLKTIETDAPNNAVAQAFLTEMQAREDAANTTQAKTDQTVTPSTDSDQPAAPPGQNE